MIRMVRGKLVIGYGKYEMVMPEGTPIGREAKESNRVAAEEIEYIKNDRIKTYILAKLIKGYKYKDILNFIFSKIHLYDTDYRDLVN